MKERYHYLDTARGVLMIMVVMCHTTGVGVPNMNQNFYPRAFWLFMLPCFFLLSGYFFKKEEKFKDMVVKKFRQLLVPYYIFILPVIVYNILNSFQLNCSIAYSFEHTAVHNDPLWFVFSLFFMITLYWIITRSVRSTYMLWGGVIILSLIGEYLRSLDLINIKWTNVLYYLIFYHIGYEINKLKFFNRSMPIWLTVVAALVFMSIAIPITISERINDFVLDSPLYFIAGIAGSYLFLQLMKIVPKKNVISFIGENSIIFLCCHQYFLFVAARGLHFSNPVLITVTSLIGCSIVAIIVNRFCPFIIGKRKVVSCQR